MSLFEENGVLPAVPPFDFAQSLAFVEMFGPARNEQRLDQSTLTKAIWAGGQPVVFRVAASGTEAKPELCFTLFSAARLDPQARAEALARLSSYLSLTDDLAPFYVIARADGPFQPILEAHFGLHHVKFMTPFENACWAILSQRRPMSVSRKAKQALIERFGSSLEVDGECYWAFPEPAQMAAAPLDALASAAGNERRAQYLQHVTHAFLTVDADWLATAPYGEVESWLRGIKGIGAWSALFILFRSLGRIEHLPFEMRQFSEAVSRVYGNGRALSAAECAAIASRYGPWQGYWSVYLRA